MWGNDVATDQSKLASGTRDQIVDATVARPPNAAAARRTAFADYPGPVLLITPSGEVTAGNEPAVPFLTGSTPEQIAELAEAAEALRRNETVPECLLRATDAAGRVAIDTFSLVPRPNTAVVVAYGREVSNELAQRNRLISITRSLRSLLDFACQFAFETDSDGALSFIAPRRVIGYQASKLAGRKPAEIFSQSPLIEVIRIFAAREPVRNVLLKGIAGDGKPIEMAARAQPIFDDAGEWIGARGTLSYVSDEDERRFAVDRERDFAVALDDLKRLFSGAGGAEHSIQQTCVQAADLLNAAGAAAYVLDPRSAEFRRVAAHGPVGEHSVDLCARPFLERLTDGRACVDGRKYRRQILTAASRDDAALVGAFVCWREEGESAWNDAERDFAEKIAVMQTAALGDVLKATSGTSIWSAPGGNAIATMTDTIAAALAARAQPGAEPSLLCLTIDNIDNLSLAAGRERVDDMVGMFGLIIRRAAGDGLVAQLEQNEFTVWLPGGGTPRARKVAEACLKMVDPLRGESSARTKIGLSIGVAIVTPGRFADFEAIQKDALQGAKISRLSGGHSYTFI